MKLNLLKFSRKKLDLSKFFITILNHELFKISSIKKGLGYPAPIILPRKLDIDEKLSEMIGLYVGDGTLNSKDITHTSFISIDTDTIAFIYKMFEERFKINKNRVTLMINYSNGNPDQLREKWTKVVGEDKEFKLRKSERNRNDALLIQINSKIFSIIFKEIIFELFPIIKCNKTLRRGFLRGYFSADGGIAIKRDPIRMNLVQLTFNYNTKTESWLRDFVLECLKKEKITNISYNEYGTEGCIQIYNWKNYLKLWKIGIFNRNERKKKKFLNVIKEMRVYIDLKKSFREDIFNETNLKQKEMAIILDSWQGNISRTIEGIHLLDIEQINTLINYTNKKWEEVLNNSIRIRIGSNTYLPVDSEFIKFVLVEKQLI